MQNFLQFGEILEVILGRVVRVVRAFVLRANGVVTAGLHSVLPGSIDVHAVLRPVFQMLRVAELVNERLDRPGLRVPS